jgi:putative ABC transport system permease protein
MAAAIPVTIPETLQSRIDSYFEGRRTMVFILGYYAGLSTVLVLTGLFGLMSQAVSRRTREIGIRMAVGARSRDLAGGILREGIMMVLPGIGIGLLTAFSLHQIFSSLISGIEPYDPWIIASAVTSLLVIAAVAAYVPARRALHIDPAVALRND